MPGGFPLRQRFQAGSSGSGKNHGTMMSGMPNLHAVFVRGPWPLSCTSLKTNMQNVLSIQSHVVFGHAGNSAAVFPMRRMGVNVWPLNTVQFSNHTQYGRWTGGVVDADELARLEADGWLGLESQLENRRREHTEAFNFTLNFMGWHEAGI